MASWVGRIDVTGPGGIHETSPGFSEDKVLTAKEVGAQFALAQVISSDMPVNGASNKERRTNVQRLDGVTSLFQGLNGTPILSSETGGQEKSEAE